LLSKKVHIRSSGNLSISRSSQSIAVGRKIMVDEEQCSGDVLTRPNVCFTKSSQIPIGGREIMLRMSTMMILVRK